MSEIFAFFLRLIELHVSQFRVNTDGGNVALAQSHGRVVQVKILIKIILLSRFKYNYYFLGCPRYVNRLRGMGFNFTYNVKRGPTIRNIMHFIK